MGIVWCMGMGVAQCMGIVWCIAWALVKVVVVVHPSAVVVDDDDNDDVIIILLSTMAQGLTSSACSGAAPMSIDNNTM